MSVIPKTTTVEVILNLLKRTESEGSPIVARLSQVLRCLPDLPRRLAHPTLFISIILFSTSALSQTHLEWQCLPSQDGETWDCQEVEVAGRARNLPSSPGAKQDKRTAEQKRLDWVPEEQLTEEQKQALPTGCCGAYLAPKREDDEADLPPEQAPTRLLNFNSIETDANGNSSISGGVKIINGSRSMEAETVEADNTDNTATISGNVVIRDAGILFRGDKATIDRSTNDTVIENGEFVAYETRLRGSAEKIESTKEHFVLENGEFTRCEPGNEHWKLHGSSIEIDHETEQGVGRNVVFDIGGVPVFYLPYMQFPAGGKRQSGFMFPSITSDDVTIPYYFNLAPNYDLTLAPRYLADAGTMLEIEARHLSESFETSLSGSWLGNGEDKISDNEQTSIDKGLLTPAEATPFDGEDRWLFGLQQEGGRDANWFSRIDFTRVSDFAYFNHIDTISLDVNRSTHLSRFGELGYNFKNWQVAARAQEYQTIIPDIEEPYRQKPRLDANGLYNWGNVELTLNNQYTQFDHRNEFYDQNNPAPADPYIIGDRLRTDYQLSWNKEWLWGFIKPSLLLKSVNYQLDDKNLNLGVDDSPGVTVPQASIDFGVYFERDGSWFGDGYLQTFEPQIFYFYSEFKDQSDFFNLTPTNRNIAFDTSELTFSYSQLFRHSRFAGSDRIEDANQVSVGLTTRFLGAESGAERFRMSLGQIYYRDDRLVSLDGAPLLETKSEIAGQFSAQMTDSWRFNSDILYDREQSKVNKGSVALRYFDDQSRIFNIGYRYTRIPITQIPGMPQPNIDESQGEISFAWPISSNWSVIGRGYYDFTKDRELDSVFGLEYTSCCYPLRLVGQRYLDNDLVNRIDDDELEYDQGIFFEFQLRGLGSIGNKISNALSDGILNYERREENLQ